MRELGGRRRGRTLEVASVGAEANKTKDEVLKGTNNSEESRAFKDYVTFS